MNFPTYYIYVHTTVYRGLVGNMTGCIYMMYMKAQILYKVLIHVYSSCIGISMLVPTYELCLCAVNSVKVPVPALVSLYCATVHP